MFHAHMFPVDSIFALAVLWSQTCFVTLYTEVFSVSTPTRDLPPVPPLQTAHYKNSLFFSSGYSNLIIKLLDLSFTEILAFSHWVLTTSVSSPYHKVPPDTH